MGLVQAPMPSSEPATADSWEIVPMPKEGIEKVVFQRALTIEDMNHLMMGHIPNCQEDHWFMYRDGQNFRIYRSLSGRCVFEASES